ncbi:MAG: VCBS repeat-containing protein, partial [Actinobacteria bacterium]|nr:VCBS repeat-containing protein [Actinomycetota bacterium]
MRRTVLRALVAAMAAGALALGGSSGVIAAGPTPTFGTAVAYSAPSSPQDVKLVDLNGDGKLDAVVSDENSNTVDVLLGNGNGTFQSAVAYPVGSEPGGLAIGDVNGDGIPDIVVADSGSGQISVLLGNGDGTFRAAINSNLGGTPIRVALADMNGDGALDAVVADYTGGGSGQVWIMNGDNTGSFAAASVIPASQPYDVAVADMNNDGYPDVVVANQHQGVAIWFGYSDGSTWQPSGTNSFAVGSNITSVSTADLNGDGLPDLTVSDYDSGEVFAGLNDGSGNFPSFTGYPTGTDSLLHSVVADVNGDGIPDVVVPSANGNDVAVLPGNGDGTFGSATLVAVGAHPNAVDAGDLNGDGNLDLVSANAQTNDVSVLLNATAPAPPGLEVAAYSSYVDSGVSIPAGDAVVVSASGTWSVGGPYGSYDANGSLGFSTETCARDTTAPEGALLGSTDGGSTWFRVGVGPTLVPGPGELLLAANDCPGFYGDNHGTQTVTIGSPSPVSGNLVQNGSFEEGYPGDNVCGGNWYSVGYSCNPSNDSIPGWIQTGGGLDWHHNTTNAGEPAAEDGTHLVDLVGNNDNGAIEQNVPTTPGHAYTLTFYYAGHPNCLGAGGTATAHVTAGSASTDISSHGTNSYTQASLAFTATSASTPISFASTGSTSSCGGVMIDNVSVVDNGPAASFTLVESATNATVVAGQTSTVDFVDFKANGPFSDSVNLLNSGAASGQTPLPAGALVSFSPATLTSASSGGPCSSSSAACGAVIVNVPLGTPAGTYNLQIGGQGVTTGIAASNPTVGINITVTSPVVHPGTTFASGDTVSLGQTDPYLQYSLDDGVTWPGQALVVQKNGAYADLPGAKWINWGSPCCGGGGADNPNEPYQTTPGGSKVDYRTFFNGPASGTSTLRVSVLCDNACEVLLDGAPFGAQPLQAIGANFQTVTVFTGPVGPGLHELRFIAHDYGPPTAFDYSATYADLSLSASPTSVTEVQGGSGASSVTVNALNGLTGNTSISVTGLPSTVHAVVSPTSVAPGASTTITFSADSNATPGTYNATVTGTNGLITHSVTIPVTVLARAIATGSNFGTVAGTTFSAVVAVFTADPSEPVSNFTATINWGDGGQPVSGTISGTGPYTVSGSHTYSTPGTYTVTTTITDSAYAANTASATATASIAPQPPVVTSGSTFTRPNNPDSVSLTGTGLPGATVTVSENGSQLNVGAVNSSGQWGPIGVTLSTGIHTLRFAQNSGGVTSSAATQAVTVRPSPLSAPSAPSNTTSATITVSGSNVIQGGTVQILDNGSQIGTATGDASRNYSTQVTLPTYGTNALTVTQSANGQTSDPSATSNVTLTPLPPTISSPTQNQSFPTNQVLFAGTGIPGATITLHPIGNTTTVAGDGTWSTTVTRLYGTFSINARQTVNNATSNLSAGVSYGVDSPAPTLSATPASVVRGSGSLLLSGTATTNPGGSNGSIIVLVDGVNHGSSFNVQSNGSWSGSIAVNTPDLLVGPHVITAEDTFGSLSTSPQSNAFPVDVVPPAPSINGVGTVASSTSPASVNVTGSGFFSGVLGGSTLTLFDGSTQVGQTTVGSNGTWSATVSLAFGNHSLIATQSLNGETSASSSPPVAVQVQPTPPVITSAPTRVAAGSSGASITLAGIAPPATTVTVYKATGPNTGVPVGTATADVSGNWTVTFSEQQIAQNTYAATATAGGVDSKISNFVVIDVAPSAPVVTGPVSVVGTTSATVTGTGFFNSLTGNGATLTLSEGATILGTTTVAADGSWSVPTTLGYGRHHVTASQISDTGEASDPSASFTVDVSPGAPTISVPAATQVTNVLASGQALPGQTVTIYDGLTQIATTTADPTGAWSSLLFLNYGPHALTATQTDNGETSAPSFEADVDVRVPAPAFTTFPAVTTSTDVVLLGSGVPGSIVTIDDGTTAVGTATVDGTGSWSAVLTLGYGTHALTATQTSNFVTSAASAVADIAVTPAAPTLTAPALSLATGVLVSGTGVPLATVSILDGGVTVATFTADVTGAYSGIVTLPYGANALTATQTAGGQTSVPSTESDVDVVAPVTGLSTTDQSGLEGATLGGAVATFANADPAATPARFQALVSWNDGSTTFGTVSSLGNGNYEVDATHTFADEGTYFGTVTIDDTVANGTTATKQLTITVGDQPLAASAGAAVSAAEGAPASVSIPFTDANPNATAADFTTATIAWGDGSTSPASVAANPSGEFVATASHSYADEGTFSASLTVADDGGATTTLTGAAAVTVTDAALAAGTLTLNEPIEGLGATNAVFSFADANPNATPADFTATVTWGDGATSTGTVTGDGSGPGGFLVKASHAYADEGSHPVSVAVSDVGGATTSGSGTATVDDAALTAGALTLNGGVEGTSASASFQFTDANPSATKADFTPVIDWGDGTTSGGVVTGSGGAFTLTGAHVYQHAGSRSVHVTVTDDGGNQASATGSLSVSGAALTPGALTLTKVAEGGTPTAASFSFTDANPFAGAGEFAATINWGDGTTTSPVVLAGGGNFSIGDSHRYADAGTYPVSVSVHSIVSGGSTSAAGSAVVTDAPLVAGHLALASAVEGGATTTLSFPFTDGNASDAGSDFKATIAWGDGTTTTGTITGSAGSFAVAGSHGYADDGQYAVTVTVTDVDGAATSAHDTATVADAPLTATGVPVTGTELSAFSGTVATFKDGNASAPASDFTALVNWGDGTPATSGVVTGSGGSYSVSGTHTYGNAGAFP